MTFSFLKLPFSTTETARMSRIDTIGRHIMDLLAACVMTVLRVDLISGLEATCV
jgi:hypothetical protein